MAKKSSRRAKKKKPEKIKPKAAPVKEAGKKPQETAKKPKAVKTKPAKVKNPKAGKKLAAPTVKTHEMREIDHVLYVETSVDKLLRMVKEKGMVRLKDAAKAFGVPKERIEEWGNILEDHKLIEMHYPPMGSAVLRVKKPKEERK